MLLTYRNILLVGGDHCVHLIVFFFIDTAPTEIYTLSLHDALPISAGDAEHVGILGLLDAQRHVGEQLTIERSEEHTSELQSHSDLVCRLLLEKKKKTRHEWTRTKTNELKYRQNNHTRETSVRQQEN